MIDGKAQISCQFPIAKAEGKSITTLEGLDQDERDTFAEAFAACGGLQCGFCIPGIVMRAKSQIDKKGAALTREDMSRHLGAHLCRCTGYVKILDAIESVATGTPVAVQPGSGMGARRAKYEAAELTLGDRGYIDDINLPGMLHAALHLTAHTRADIVSIDYSEAKKAPGVEAVFTKNDVPGDNMVGIIYKDWPVFIGEGDTTSYGGDVLAVVVARTRRQARAAAQLIKVHYNPHTPVVDPVKALDNTVIAVAGTTSNILSHSTYQRGDVELSLSQSAFVVSETFQTQPLRFPTHKLELFMSIQVVKECGTIAIRSVHFYILTKTWSLLNWSPTEAHLVEKKTCPIKATLP